MTRLFPNSTTDYGGYFTWASTYGNVAIKERVASYSASFWRMMTTDEWTYLLNTRSVSHARYHFATVAGTKGVILYPDTYTPGAAGVSAVSAKGSVSADDWRKMQLQVCVFLPAAGGYQSDGLRNEGTTAIVWTRDSGRSVTTGKNVCISTGELYFGTPTATYKSSVRLVRNL